MKNYGIPYMGSKSRFISSVAMNFPKAENFYDLFGGGFSVTHYMLDQMSHRYKYFHYNEICSEIVDLVKRAIAGEFNYDVFKPAWISRDDFSRLKDSDAYISICWSFGNSRKAYLFSQDIEPYKKSMHQAVVFDEFDDLSAKVLGFESWPRMYKTVFDKRFFLRRKIENYRKTKIPEFLLEFLSAKQLEQLERLEQLQQLERLEQLQQLERLEQLQQLQQLEFYSTDYRDVPIKENSVVYCDIPYIGCAPYLVNIDHQEFYDWAATRPFPVFISDYRLDDSRFKLVYSVDVRSMLANASYAPNKIMSENIYWNGV